MRVQTACFTGHRKIDDKDLISLPKKLEEVIAEQANRGVIFWMNGGACGFDHIAAFAVLEVRKKVPEVCLIMVLPCKNQDKFWSEAEKQKYSYLLENATEVVYVSEQPYFDGCMKLRNQNIVDRSSICIAYMKHGRTGTSQTIRMAKESGVTVINLASDNFPKNQ